MTAATAGPTIPQRLNCKPPSVTAEGNSSFVTTSGTSALQAGALNANPIPIIKTEARITNGFRYPSAPSTARDAAEKASQKFIVDNNFFRSTRSAREPAGRVKKKRGRAATVWDGSSGHETRQRRSSCLAQVPPVRCWRNCSSRMEQAGWLLLHHPGRNWNWPAVLLPMKSFRSTGKNPDRHRNRLRELNPTGFDYIAEATGSAFVCEDALQFVRRGGTLLVYGVYPETETVRFNPFDLFRREITIKGSFAQIDAFPRALAYLESGKIKVNEIVTDEFALEDWPKVLEHAWARKGIKIAVIPPS